MTALARLAIAAVWLYQGGWCKLVAPNERHLQVVAGVPGVGPVHARKVLALVGNHLKPGQLYDDRERVSDGAIRRLARKCEPALLFRVARADCLGRRGDFPPVAMDWFLEKARDLGVDRSPPKPLLLGRHLLELGMKPGPEMGELLKAHLQEAFGREVLFLHGGTPREARARMVERFQTDADGPRLFLLSLKAGGPKGFAK